MILKDLTGVPHTTSVGHVLTAHLRTCLTKPTAFFSQKTLQASISSVNISAAAVTASVLPWGHEAPAGSHFLPGLLQLLPCPPDRAGCIKTDQLLIQAVLAGWRAPRQPISHPAHNKIWLCCCSVFIAVPEVIVLFIFYVRGF